MSATALAIQSAPHVNYEVAAPAGPVRLCTGCGLPIPTARLRIMPNARQCVKCLEALGDVPRFRRYDETTADNEVISTAFTDRQSVHAYVKREPTMEFAETLDAPEEQERVMQETFNVLEAMRADIQTGFWNELEGERA